MSDKTAISWADSSWNPTTGCVPVSEGCDNCYARAMAERFRGSTAWPHGFEFTLHPGRLDQPRKWKKPRRIFVDSMSDLFYTPREFKADEDWMVGVRGFSKRFLWCIWESMLKSDHHTYMILTKRPKPALRLIKELGLEMAPHIWIGVSVENQYWADRRIPELLAIPASKVWISAEPLLGPVDLSQYYGLSWVILGGESGPKRRPMALDWARAVRDQCVEAGVPFFFKQESALYPGTNPTLDGKEWHQYPEVET